VLLHNFSFLFVLVIMEYTLPNHPAVQQIVFEKTIFLEGNHCSVVEAAKVINEKAGVNREC